MADGDEAKAGLEALAKSITASIEGVSATEQAIQKQIQSFVEASSQTITELVKTNVPSPDIAQENLKIQQAITDSTLAAIKALTPPKMPDGDS